MCAALYVHLIEQDTCAPRPEGRVAPSFVCIIYVPHQLSFLIKIKLLNEHIYDVNNHQSWVFPLKGFLENQQTCEKNNFCYNNDEAKKKSCSCTPASQ